MIRTTAICSVWNSALWIEYCLKWAYPFFDRIVIAETNWTSDDARWAGATSPDGTADLICAFPDPEKKLDFYQLGRWNQGCLAARAELCSHIPASEWVYVLDCLPGHRVIPVRIDGKTDFLYLSEIFDHYAGQLSATMESNGKESVATPGLETLSFVKTRVPEHTLRRDERGSILDPHFKALLVNPQREAVEDWEGGANVFAAKDVSEAHVTRFNAACRARDILSNMIDYQGAWKPVSKVVRSITTEPLVRIRQKYGEVECTRNHRVATTLKGDEPYYQAASDVESSLVQIGSIQNETEPQDTLALSDWLTLDGYVVHDGMLRWASRRSDQKQFYLQNALSAERLENFCEAIGYYVAEGSIDTSCSGTWRICGKEADVYRYRDYLSALGSFTSTTGLSKKADGKRHLRDVHYLSITSSVIVRTFAQLCGIGCHEKKVPSFIFSLGRRFKEAFLRGYCAGDGSVAKHRGKGQRDRSRRSGTSATTSAKLVAGICYLHKQLGRRYSLSYREPYGNHARSYSVTHGVSIDHATRNNLAAQLLGATTNFVYDLVVPETHNFCDGMGLVVVHNCDEFQSQHFLKTLDRELDKFKKQGINTISQHTRSFYWDFTRHTVEGFTRWFRWQPGFNAWNVQYAAPQDFSVPREWGPLDPWSTTMGPEIFHYSYVPPPGVEIKGAQSFDVATERYQSWYRDTFRRFDGSNLDEVYDSNGGGVHVFGGLPVRDYTGDHPSVLDTHPLRFARWQGDGYMGLYGLPVDLKGWWSN